MTKLFPEHSHLPDCSKNLVNRTKDAIGLQSSESREATSSIIQKCTEDFPLPAAASLPEMESPSRFVQRQRCSPEGNSVAEDMELTTDVTDVTGDVILLTTNANLDFLAACPN